MAVGLGLFAALRNDVAMQKDAVVISQRALPLSEKWCGICREYPELGKQTDVFLRASPIGAMIGEVVGIGILIASNHGWALPGTGGV